MHRRRGSAIIFVLVMVVAITAILLVAMEFSMQHMRNQKRYEDDAVIRYTWEAAVSQIDADAATGNLALPNSRTFTLNGISATVATIDNSASLANTLKATATLTTADGRSYPVSSVFANSAKANPFWYAVAINSGISSASSLTTGASSANGDIYSNGNISLTNGSSIVNGNAVATGTINAGLTVTGSKKPLSTAMTWPTIDGQQYYASQTGSIAAGSTLNGYTFSTVTAGQPYPVIYCGGALTFSGAVTGIGTIYVAGTLNINGTITYANSSSRIAFITPNAFSMDQNCVGYYFTTGALTFSGGKTNSKGGAYGSTSTNSATTSVTLDPAIKSTPNEGILMHLPSLWTYSGNTFGGTRSGTYIVVANTDTGTLTLNIDSAGNCTGTTHDNGLNATASVTGTVNSAGAFSFTYIYPTFTAIQTGTMSFVGGNLVGTGPNVSQYGTFTETFTIS